MHFQCDDTLWKDIILHARDWDDEMEKINREMDRIDRYRKRKRDQGEETSSSSSSSAEDEPEEDDESSSSSSEGSLPELIPIIR